MEICGIQYPGIINQIYTPRICLPAYRAIRRTRYRIRCIRQSAIEMEWTFLVIKFAEWSHKKIKPGDSFIMFRPGDVIFNNLTVDDGIVSMVLNNPQMIYLKDKSLIRSMSNNFVKHFSADIASVQKLK